jgi:hypothetical protein
LGEDGGVTPADHRTCSGARAIWLLVLVVLGAANWAVTWFLIGETAEGARKVAGLSEGNLRAIQNPGTLLILIVIANAWGRFRLRLPALARLALAITFLALTLTLVGNVVEFGIWGEGPLDSQDPGAAIFFTGLYVLQFGLILLVVSGVYALCRYARRGTREGYQTRG